MRVIGATALVALSLPLLAGCGDDEGGESDGGPASAPSFEAELPSGWSEGGDEALETATNAATLGAASTLGVDPGELNIEAEAVWLDDGSEGAFTTNVNVLAEEIPPELGEDNYVDASLGTVDALPEVSDFKELDPVEIDGDPAEQVVYEAAPSGATLRFRSIALVHDGEGFNITLTAAAEAFDAASAELDDIVASWQWTD